MLTSVTLSALTVLWFPTFPRPGPLSRLSTPSYVLEPLGERCALPSFFGLLLILGAFPKSCSHRNSLPPSQRLTPGFPQARLLLAPPVTFHPRWQRRFQRPSTFSRNTLGGCFPLSEGSKENAKRQVPGSLLRRPRQVETDKHNSWGTRNQQVHQAPRWYLQTRPRRRGQGARLEQHRHV